MKICGTVRRRSSVNNKIPTGQVEILADQLHVFAAAETTPFEISDDAGVNVVDSVICYDAPDDEGEAACKALGAELA